MSNTSSINKTISEIIKERTSVRTYEECEIDEDKIVKIEEYINNLKGPFNEKVRFKLINSKEPLKGEKIGTYGIIKGANNFIAVAYENGEMALEEVGYEMEKVILYITSLGLGTCWIGGTFNKGEFSKSMELKEDELLPIVTPFGKSGENKRFIEKTMKFLTKSKKRKEWYEIFFLRDFSVPLTPVINLGYFKEVLENVRLAPSALNKQPWRIVKDGNKFHFYINSSKKKNDKLTFDIHRIDMGIAMCHFDLTCKELGLEGRFIKCNPEITDTPKNISYVITWVHESV